MATIRIRYNAANIRGLGPDFQLRPGINEVPENVLQKFAGHPEIVRLVKDGTIEPLDGDKIEPAKAPRGARGGRKAAVKADEQADDDGEQAGAEPSKAALAAQIAALAGE